MGVKLGNPRAVVERRHSDVGLPVRLHAGLLRVQEQRQRRGGSAVWQEEDTGVTTALWSPVDEGSSGYSDEGQRRASWAPEKPKQEKDTTRQEGMQTETNTLALGLNPADRPEITTVLQFAASPPERSADAVERVHEPVNGTPRARTKPVQQQSSTASDDRLTAGSGAHHATGIWTVSACDGDHEGEGDDRAPEETNGVRGNPTQPPPPPPPPRLVRASSLLKIFQQRSMESTPQGASLNGTPTHVAAAAVSDTGAAAGEYWSTNLETSPPGLCSVATINSRAPSSDAVSRRRLRLMSDGEGHATVDGDSGAQNDSGRDSGGACDATGRREETGCNGAGSDERETSVAGVRVFDFQTTSRATALPVPADDDEQPLPDVLWSPKAHSEDMGADDHREESSAPALMELGYVSRELYRSPTADLPVLDTAVLSPFLMPFRDASVVCLETLPGPHQPPAGHSSDLGDDEAEAVERLSLHPSRTSSSFLSIFQLPPQVAVDGVGFSTKEKAHGDARGSFGVDAGDLSVDSSSVDGNTAVASSAGTSWSGTPHPLEYGAPVDSYSCSPRRQHGEGGSANCASTPTTRTWRFPLATSPRPPPLIQPSIGDLFASSDDKLPSPSSATTVFPTIATPPRPMRFRKAPDGRMVVSDTPPVPVTRRSRRRLRKSDQQNAAAVEAALEPGTSSDEGYSDDDDDDRYDFLRSKRTSCERPRGSSYTVSTGLRGVSSRAPPTLSRHAQSEGGGGEPFDALATYDDMAVKLAAALRMVQQSDDWGEQSYSGGGGGGRRQEEKSGVIGSRRSSGWSAGSSGASSKRPSGIFTKLRKTFSLEAKQTCPLTKMSCMDQHKATLLAESLMSPVGRTRRESLVLDDDVSATFQELELHVQPGVAKKEHGRRLRRGVGAGRRLLE